MPVTMLTVTNGTGDWVLPNGELAQGGVTAQPLQEGTDNGDIIANVPVSLPVTAGKLTGQLAWLPGMQFLITENIKGAKNPAPYVVVPTGSTLDLSTAPRAIVGVVSAPFVQASSVGAVGGPAGPLGANGHLPGTQSAQPWEIAEAFAGLSDPSVITDFQPGMDPNTSITLAAGTYVNKHFLCSVLHIPNSNTQLINCRIECFNADRGVRFDEDGGTAVRRRLEHCQITAVGTATNGAGFDLLLCKVTGNGDDSMRLGRGQVPTTLTYCHFSDFRPPSGAHVDGVQIVTWPAADVHAYGCSISMAPQAGYTMPGDAGFTGALFYDPTDVAISVSDPEPNRRGQVWFDWCKLSSSQNYSVVVDQPGVRLTNCTIAKGSTDYVSNPNTSVITGWGNVDPDGAALTGVDVGGILPEPYTLARAQDVDFFTLAPTDGQVPVFDGDTGLWKPGSAAGSTSLAVLSDVDVSTASSGQVLTLNAGTSRWSGATPFKPTIRSAYITTGDIAVPNTSGAWQKATQVGGASIELDVPAAVGDWVEVGYNGVQSSTHAVDVAVLVGTTQVRYMATGTATPAADGDTGWYGQGFTGDPRLTSTPRGFTVTSGDLDGGSVRFVLVVKSAAASGTISANPNDTFYWQAKNLGPHL